MSKLKDIQGCVNDLRDNKLDKTSYRIMTGLLATVFISILGWLIVSSNRIEVKVDTVNSNYAKIKEDIGELRNDVSWLKSLRDKNVMKFNSIMYGYGG